LSFRDFFKTAKNENLLPSFPSLQHHAKFWLSVFLRNRIASAHNVLFPFLVEELPPFQPFLAGRFVRVGEKAAIPN